MMETCSGAKRAPVGRQTCLIGRHKNHVNTDADSSTHAIGGWTKNTQKPDLKKKKRKNHQKRKNSKKSRDMPKLAIRPSTRQRQNQQKKKKKICAAILDPFQTKIFKR